MNFSLKESKTFDNGDYLYRYSYDSIESVPSLCDFMRSFEKENGTVSSIKVLNDSDDHKFMGEYESVEQFGERFSRYGVDYIGMLQFSSREKSIDCSFDQSNHEFSISSLYNTLSQNKSNGVLYYRDEDGSYAKYDSINDKYYSQNNKTKEWYEDEDLERRLMDPAYTYERCENIGEGKRI